MVSFDVESFTSLKLKTVLGKTLRFILPHQKRTNHRCTETVSEDNSEYENTSMVSI